MSDEMSSAEFRAMYDRSGMGKVERSKYGNKRGYVSDAFPAQVFKTRAEAQARYGTDARVRYFASKKEHGRWLDLLALHAAGEIVQLDTQKAFLLRPKFEVVGQKFGKWKYFIDFWYWDKRDHLWIGEDVKGYETRMFNVKWAQLHYEYREQIEGGLWRFEIVK